jgi:transcription elongation factor Elf1
MAHSKRELKRWGITLKKVSPKHVVRVTAHCIEFNCPACGDNHIGEGYIEYNKQQKPLVHCLTCGSKFPARLARL